MTGEIPQSLALREASPSSLDELFSRDPEHYSTQDLDRIVHALREQRERWAKTEAEPKSRAVRAVKAAPRAAQKLSAEDLASLLGTPE